MISRNPIEQHDLTLNTAQRHPYVPVNPCS
jgi:hypothetical protein